MAALSLWLSRWQLARPWLLLAAALTVGLAAACVEWSSVFVGPDEVNFVDADCYSRMTRVREVCQHPGEVIRRHTFENYPFGTHPHTTVPLDYAVLALRGLLGVVTHHEAQDLAGAWISPLLGVLTIIGVWLWLERCRLKGEWFALLIIGASPIVAHGFQLGRPDHQSLVMACMVWALAAEWAQWRGPSVGWGLVSGVAWALGLWTSLYEPLILLVAVLAAGLIWHRSMLLTRARVPSLAVGGIILAAALWIEGWRIDAVPGFGEGNSAEHFAAWPARSANWPVCHLGRRHSIPGQD